MELERLLFELERAGCSGADLVAVVQEVGLEQKRFAGVNRRGVVASLVIVLRQIRAQGI
jgi:hypothetical protein